LRSCNYKLVSSLDFAKLRTNNEGVELAEAINKRLSELAWSLEEFSRQSEVSSSTLRRMVKGTKDEASMPRERRIERALGWKPGSIEAIRAGEEPELLDQPKEHTATTVGAPSGGLPTDSEGLKRLIREAVAEALADRLP
jgi:lambda repressor-like predicted transcriptional regulator